MNRPLAAEKEGAFLPLPRLRVADSARGQTEYDVDVIGWTPLDDAGDPHAGNSSVSGKGRIEGTVLLYLARACREDTSMTGKIRRVKKPFGIERATKVAVA